MLVSLRPFTVLLPILLAVGKHLPNVPPEATTAAAPIRLALTFDDLPWVGPLPDGDSAGQAIARMAAVLRVHQAPATGFVVCDRARQDAQPLRTWVSWGFALGNHSAAHRDLNRTPEDEWLADVARCDRYLQQYGEAYIPYFRFPMLHQGDTPEKRDRVAAALRAMGLKTAHVTVDNSEWILARIHAAALAQQQAAVRRAVGQAFIRHIVDAVLHAVAVARRKAGRAVPHVLLLHANTLVADHLDALLLELRAHGVTFISLEEALADSSYVRQDEYVGPKGLSWLYRMQPVSAEDVRWDDAEAAAITARFSEAYVTAQAPGPVSYTSLSPKAPVGFDAIFAEAGASERMRSLLVMHKGELVAEAYFNGAGPETPVNLKSITKSLTSALVGVTLRNGWIESLETPIARYLPERFAGRTSAAKAGITVRQLLTMSSGLAPANYGVIQQRADWVGYVLDQPLDEAARGTFAYDTPVLQLLTAVLEAASGMPLGELATRELLGPLGTDLPYWRTDAQGLALGGNDAYLRPRALVRLGELYRRGGLMNEHRLLDAAFVQASTTVQVVPDDPTVNHGTLSVRGYGYLWWLIDVEGEAVYAALGHGGQVLMVAPRRELVVLMTSRWPGPSSRAHYRHLTRLLVERIWPLFL